MKGEKMALLNYTTTVEAYKTVSEIEQMLVKHGAKSIMKQFDDGMITSLSFLINTGVNDIPIKLPIRVDDVLQVLIEQKKMHPKAGREDGNKDVVNLLVDKKDIIENALKTVSQKHAVLSRQITIKSDIMKELNMGSQR